MTKHIKKMQENARRELFIEEQFENTRSFLETYVGNIVKFSHDNFEVFHLTVTENSIMGESIQGEVTDAICEYIKKNLPNKKIDYKTYGMSITAFVYALNIEKYHGRTDSFDDEETIIKNFINILYCMTKN